MLCQPWTASHTSFSPSMPHISPCDHNSNETSSTKKTIIIVAGEKGSICLVFNMRTCIPNMFSPEVAKVWLEFTGSTAHSIQRQAGSSRIKHLHTLEEMNIPRLGSYLTTLFHFVQLQFPATSIRTTVTIWTTQTYKQILQQNKLFYWIVIKIKINFCIRMICVSHHIIWSIT